jgi:hypothetical protein
MTTNPYESPKNKSDSRQPPSDWFAAGIRIVVLLGLTCLLLLMVTPRRFLSSGPRESARRINCHNNLRNIAMALQSYESTYGSLPPAYTTDATGKPLHSWRALILPYIDQQRLYHQIDFSKPWDDPANRAAYETRLKLYECPSSTVDKSHTTYLAVVAPGGYFKLSAPRKIADIKDGRDLTLMLIEVSEKHAVHWMSPNDATEELILNREADGDFSHPRGAWAACVSGRMLFLPPDTKPDVLRALVSIDAGDDAVAKKVH